MFHILFKFTLMTLFIAIKSYAQPDILQGSETKTFTESKRLLSDLPELNVENLRFLLPRDKWIYFQREFLKGDILEISFKNTTEKKLKIFEAINSTTTDFSYQDMILKVKDKSICEFSTTSKIERSKEFYVCKHYYCAKNESTKEEQITNYLGLRMRNISRSSLPEMKDCPYHFKIYPHEFKSNSVLIEYVKNKSNEDRISLNEKGSLFIDVTNCDKGGCNFINKPFSAFETAWINLKVTQTNKNDNLLNHLINNLLPCVKKRDRNCVEKYFPTKEESDEYGGSVSKQKKLVIDDEVFKDLETCLDYSQLLPYGGRAKARNDKICIFFPEKNKLHSITLPDAYSEQGVERKVNYHLTNSL